MRLYLLPLAFVSSISIASANTCEVAISSADTWSYDTKAISVPAECKEFTVNFSHKGKLSKEGLGHNWVLAKTADVNAIAQDGGTQGLENNFLKPGDERVIANTPIIGGGESTSTTFKTSVLDANENYTFFCSFPGHTFMMRGTLKVAE